MSEAHTSTENQKKIYSNAEDGVPVERGGSFPPVIGSCVSVADCRRELYGCRGPRRVDGERNDRLITAVGGGVRVWTLEVAGLGFSDFHFLYKTPIRHHFDVV